MTTQKVTFLSDLHFEHQQWLSELSLWDDEIDFFEKELENVVKNWTDKEVLKKAEHFQNVFIIQKEEIKKLRDSIQHHESVLSELAKKHSKSVKKNLSLTII